MNNRAEALYQHLLALDRLDEARAEASADYNERKKLAKEDGFDVNILEAIRKRRKKGQGDTMRFDEMLAEYEQMIEKQEQEHADRRQYTVTVIGRGDATATDADDAPAAVDADEEASPPEHDDDPDGDQLRDEPPEQFAPDNGMPF